MVSILVQILLENNFRQEKITRIGDYYETDKIKKCSAFVFIYDPDILQQSEIRRVYDSLNVTSAVKYYFNTLQMNDAESENTSCLGLIAGKRMIDFPALSFYCPLITEEIPFAVLSGSGPTHNKAVHDTFTEMKVLPINYGELMTSLSTISPIDTCQAFTSNALLGAINNNISLGKAVMLTKDKKDFITTSVDFISELLKYKLNDGDLITNSFNLNIIYKKKVNIDHKKSHFWLYGKTNVGKSTMIDAMASMYNVAKISPCISTHLGINFNTQIVNIDESASSNKFNYTTLNELADNAFKFKILYANHFAISDYIVIVTSNQSMEEVYPIPDQIKTLNSRFNVVCLDKLLEEYPLILKEREFSPEQRLGVFAITSLESLSEEELSNCIRDLRTTNLSNATVSKNREIFKSITKRQVSDVLFEYSFPPITPLPITEENIDASLLISSYRINLRQAVFKNNVSISKNDVAAILSNLQNKRWTQNMISDQACDAMAFSILLAEQSKIKTIFKIENEDDTRIDTNNENEK